MRRAYLSIRSALPLAAISRHMGAPGEEGSVSAGEPRPHNPTDAYRISSWKKHSNAPQGASLDVHLASLWRRIAPLRHRLLNLPPEMTGWVNCVAEFDNSSDPADISAGHFATAGYYALRMDCDFYFSDGFGTESHPYWKW